MRKVLAILALLSAQGAHAQLIANPGILPSNTLVSGNCVQATGSNSVDTAPAGPCLTTTAAAGLYLPMTGGNLTGNTTVTSPIAGSGPAFLATNNSGSGSTLSASTSSSLGSALSTFLAQGSSSSGGPSLGFTNTANGINQKTWDIYENPTSLSFRTSDDANSSNATWLSAARSGYAITGIISNSGSGTWAHTGSFSTTGNIVAQGVLSSTVNTTIAGPLNTGVNLGGAANYSIEAFYNQTYTANNRTVQWIWFNNAFSLRFASDDGSTVATPFSVSGGQGTGITGIASDSGSGTWAHTGNFTATGTISTAFPSGNNMVLSGAANGATPSLMTSGSNVNVSMNIGTKGGGGINLLSNTAVTGNLSAGSATITGGGAIGSSLTVGSTTPATVATGEQAFTKITASGTAPGVGFLKIAATAGTTAGTCKIIAYAGTSTTPVTIVDNVGSGC